MRKEGRGGGEREKREGREKWVIKSMIKSDKQQKITTFFSSDHLPFKPHYPQRCSLTLLNSTYP
jgi:hypothetical protein